MRVLRAALLAALLAASAGAAGAREPITGLPCEGCEAVFDGMPATLADRARVAPIGEPGAPMVVTGRVTDRSGRPAAGIVVYAYQTNAAGVYPPPAHAAGPAARRHGALRGWARTDANGLYAFDTIRPGAYAGRDVPQHIHLHVIEPGCSTYYIDDLMFRDDPRLTPGQVRALASGRGGDGITRPRRVGRTWYARRDIRLGRAIPGDRPCPVPPAR